MISQIDLSFIHLKFSSCSSLLIFWNHFLHWEIAGCINFTTILWWILSLVQSIFIFIQISLNNFWHWKSFNNIQESFRNIRERVGDFCVQFHQSRPASVKVRKVLSSGIPSSGNQTSRRFLVPNSTCREPEANWRSIQSLSQWIFARLCRLGMVVARKLTLSYNTGYTLVDPEYCRRSSWDRQNSIQP